MIFVVLGVEVGIKNRSKIDQNLKPKMNGLLASIFGGFWWVLGGKLASKIEPRSNKNRFKIRSKKRVRPDREKTAPGRFLEGGFLSAPAHGSRRGEGRVGCTKPTYPQKTDPLQQNYLSDRNLLRKSVKCDK